MTALPASEPLLCVHGLRRQTIVQSLLADIFEGRLRPGERLVTQTLADRFLVSHTPIREALITLAGIGLVDLVPNRGAIVRAVTAREVKEICQVRRLLECQATRNACGHMDLHQLQVLAEELHRLRTQSWNIAEFVLRARQVDTTLHDLIAGSCGNAFLAQELGRLKVLFRAFRDLSYVHHQAQNDHRRLTDEAGEHLAIVQALIHGDGKAAAQAMARHIRSGVKYWTRAMPAVSQPG